MCIRTAIASLDELRRQSGGERGGRRTGRSSSSTTRAQDATARVLAEEFPTVRHIRNPVNLYYTRAVNQGMRAAKGDWVFLLNDDIELESQVDTGAPRVRQEAPQVRRGRTRDVYPDGRPGFSAHKFPTPIREILNTLGITELFKNSARRSGCGRNTARP